MGVVRLPDLAKASATGAVRYVEFQRSSDMSSGLYLLPAGSTDPQGPHTEDECYLVVQGRGKVQVGEEVSPVAPGDYVFVPALMPHRFFDIEADLVLLVVFAPAEYARRTA